MPREQTLPPSPISGVWLPIVTPFLDGELDLESYERLLGFYLNQGITGLVPLGTTGESPTIEPYEGEALIDLTLEIVDRRVPVYVGIGGNSTRKVTQLIQRFGRFGFNGIGKPARAGTVAHGANERSLAADRESPASRVSTSIVADFPHLVMTT